MIGTKKNSNKKQNYIIIKKKNHHTNLKLIFNSILGGFLIYFINQIGAPFNLHIGLNIITSIFIGIFGIPGAVLLLLLKIF